MKVLLTGGAGFIGSHLARRLLREGNDVTILDNFDPQVHGGQRSLPEDLEGHVQLFIGDVRDRDAFGQAFDGQDAVVHLAAETGTGQSMYQIGRYADVNVGGTAVLLEGLVNSKARSVQKLILASSRAVYGEGKYLCSAHGVVYPASRRAEDLQAGILEPRCPTCQAACQPLPTDEDSPFRPASFYGITKQTQEQMVSLFGQMLHLPTFILRYQNVYGPGQSLRNPYTGILAVFSALARADQPIHVFEDGQESRDFVHVEDAVEAAWSCLHCQATSVQVLNVGSGKRTTVSQVVAAIIGHFDSSSPVTVTGEFRLGDVRHNVADLARARQTIAFVPQWGFDQGIRQFLAWAEVHAADANGYESSLQEMRDKGLLNG
jgi:dTDP-L-rhamnose 4-epimerase